jgi:methionyl-tRNA synthetase
MSDPNRLYITTPIYYLNDKPHIGHAYTTIAGDVIARMHRLFGGEAFYLTGTDEHGTKVAESAAAHGVAPQAFCDAQSALFRAAWQTLGIKFDDFIRTTEERHRRAVHKFLQRLHSAKAPDGRPVIYPGTYSGLYCVGCERFLTEKELVDGLCPDHKTPPVTVSEKNYFFRLRSFVPRVGAMIEKGEIVIRPPERKAEVLGLIKQGLEDFSLSREKVKWGIPLPFDSSQNTYVWVEALQNYITAAGYGDDRKRFDRLWAHGHVLHLMGKDILKFHAVFWPAMLIAAGEMPPDELFVHGYFTVGGTKMSKSLGNVIAPQDMINQFGVDGTRYLLLTQFPFGADGDIQADRLLDRYNADLANDLGNLTSRVVKFCERIGSSVPEPGELSSEDRALLVAGRKAVDTTRAELANRNVLAMLNAPMELVRAANRYVEANAPWQLQKDGNTERLKTVLYTALEAIRVASAMLEPVMPAKMREIRKAIGVPQDKLDPSAKELEHLRFLAPGTPLGMGESVFPRLDKDKKSVGVETPKAAVADKAQGDGLIDISEFGKVQLAVAEVLEAARVDGADRLLQLKIKLGDEERPLVAGIAEHYKPEDLIGRRIVVVKNLKPAKIKGIESRGMLLAAKQGKRLVLLTTDGEIPSGASVG